MIQYFLLEKSLVPNKKYTIYRFDSTGKLPLKKISFGASGYEDYTTHKNEERKNMYIARHRGREDWTKSGINTAGFWAKHLLWNKPSLSESIKDTEKKFNIKINT